MGGFIPVNGFVGSAQQTPAGALAQQPRGMRSGTKRRRSGKKKRAGAKRKAGRRKASGRKAKMTKGSAAAKAWGRKMKALRKKR